MPKKILNTRVVKVRVVKDEKNYQNSENVIGRFSFDVDAIDLNDLVATGYKAWKHWKTNYIIIILITWLLIT